MPYQNYPYHSNHRSGKPELPELRHVLICGFMGAGKSSVGRFVAEELQLPFYDLDKFIEVKEAMAVSRIFSNFGESYFRKVERNSLDELLSKPKSVIALGGGTLQSQEMVNQLKGKNVLVYLDVPLPLIVSRIKNSKTRPLLFNEDGSKKDIKQLRTYLYDLHKKREVLYQQADYHLKVDPDWSREITVVKVTEYIREYVPHS